jgi:hypothetical protein
VSRVREPLSVDGFRGFRYDALDAEVEAALSGWLSTGTVAGAEVLKPGAVHRWRDLVVKFGGPHRRLADRLRPAPAIREADLHAALLPIPTPRPLVALARRELGAVIAELHVAEYVPGEHLHELFRTNAEAVERFPAFIAGMHVRGVFHGDLHTSNAIWNGTEWVLLDLDGIRHGLHRVRRQRMILNQWALLSFHVEAQVGASDAELRPLFEDYARRSGLVPDVAASWERVQRGIVGLRRAQAEHDARSS